MNNSMNGKIESLVNSVGTIYLGDWLIDLYDDLELKKEIHRRADNLMSSYVKKELSINKTKDIVVLSLILASIDFYDGTFYPHLEEYYPNVFECDFSELYINNKFIEVMSATLPKEGNFGTRHYNEVLIQTFVPKKYLGNFFNFVFDIYKYNYDYFLFGASENKDINSELETELKYLFGALFYNHLNILDVNTIYKLNIDNSYKEYELIVSTRRALSQNNVVESVIPIVINILKIIDADYWEKDVGQLIKNKYYEFGYKAWLKDKNHENNSTNEKGKRLQEFNAVEILKPKVIQYNFNKNTISLKTRRHNISLKDGRTYDRRIDNFKIVIENEGNIVKSIGNLAIKQIVGGIKIDPLTIEIDDFMNTLDYKLYHNCPSIIKL